MYGDERMSRASIHRWYESLEEGRMNTLLKGGPGVPHRQTDEIVQNTSATFVADDDLQTLEEIAQLANISKLSGIPRKRLAYWKRN